MSAGTITGLGPWQWVVPLAPESGMAFIARLAHIPLSEGRRRLPFTRVRPALLRRRDRDGAEYFVVTRTLWPTSERLYPRVVDDVLTVTQVMPRWEQVYTFIFVAIMYAVGLGGVIAAVAVNPGYLVLLTFPVFMRFVNLPLVRSRDRDAAKAFFTGLALAVSSQP